MGRPQKSPTASGHVPDTEIQMTTHLTHPLTESKANQGCAEDSVSNLNDPFAFSMDDLEQMYIDDLFTYSIADNMHV